MEFYNTLETQVEIFPRLTIIYGKTIPEVSVKYGEEEHIEVIKNGFAIEWLWFGVFIEVS